MERWRFHIERCEHLYVLRDDLLPGGSKRRALDLLLPTMPQEDFAYAGTIFGHGALALALACRDHDRRAHLFLACNDLGHPMMAKLKETGAIIERAAPLPVADLFSRACEFARMTGAHVFPLAFDTPDFHEAMRRSLSKLDVSPYPEIWCSRVSGTFAGALQKAFPALPLRIVSTVAGQDLDGYVAPEKYHRPALVPPAYPACAYTDAKIWRFAAPHAVENALIWNIAG